MISLLSSSPLSGDDSYGTFNLSFENDTILRTDRCYTGGAKLGWMSNDLKNYRQKPLLKWLPFVNRKEFQHSVFLSLCQGLYTPDDITRPELIEDDRPYAGILFLALGIHSIGPRWMETWELNLGIIGPHAFAEESQKIIHFLFKGDKALGWHHQLKDELALQLIYERKWRALQFRPKTGFGFDLLPYIGAGLGNVHIYASMGTQFRLGWNLPDDYGPSLIRPGGDRNFSPRCRGPLGFFLFAGVDGKAVGRDIFLDGNTLRKSHRVDKNPWILDITLGVGMRIGRVNISYAFVFWTKRFKTETKEHKFGAVNISLSY